MTAFLCLSVTVIAFLMDVMHILYISSVCLCAQVWWRLGAVRSVNPGCTKSDWNRTAPGSQWWSGKPQREQETPGHMEVTQENYIVNETETQATGSNSGNLRNKWKGTYQTCPVRKQVCYCWKTQMKLLLVWNTVIDLVEILAAINLRVFFFIVFLKQGKLASVLEHQYLT